MTVSAISNQALWGQAFKLVVTSTPGSPPVTVADCETWQPEAVRITFNVLQSMNTEPLWFADISVYNTDPGTQNVLLNATWATLSAGFQTGPNKSAVIWDGPVFQSLFTLEGVVDQKVTLNCLASPNSEILNNIVSFSTGPYSSQALLVAKMAAQIGIPPMSQAAGNVGPVAQQRMDALQYPRGKTVFGSIAKYLVQVSDHNFVQFWQDGKQAYLSEVASGATTPSLIYSPAFPPGGIQAAANLPAGTTQSIIGTPQQVQQGAVFTVMLDPRLKVSAPPILVQLAETQITQMMRTPTVQSESPASILSADLSFFVSQVRHVGDSRGNDWHTEVVGWSTGYAEKLLGQFGA